MTLRWKTLVLLAVTVGMVAWVSYRAGWQSAAYRYAGDGILIVNGTKRELMVSALGDDGKWLPVIRFVPPHGGVRIPDWSN